MLKGNWVFDGQPIRMTESGTVLDGQHRLSAIVLSETSQEFLVVSGIKSDAFKVMDTGKNRSSGDVLGIKGYEHSTNLSSIAKLIISHNNNLNGGRGNDKISNTDVLDFIEKNENLMVLLKGSQKYYKEFQRVLPLSQIVFYRYIFSKKDVVASDDFWSKVCFGLGLEDKSPTKALRNLLIKDKLSKTSLPAKEKKALIIKAWNYYRADRGVSFIRWNKENEKFPTAI